MATTASGIVYPVVTDDVDVSGDMLAMANSLETLLAFPLCKLILNAAFGVANNSNAVSIPFGSGSENIKTAAGMHSTSVNTTRVIPTIPGYYEVTGNTVFATNTSGYRTHTIGKNGVRQAPETGVYTAAGLAAGANTPLPPVTSILSANGTTDYFELFAFQNSGGTLNVVGDASPTTTGNTMLLVKYLRPL
jgi:hypothetical protein